MKLRACFVIVSFLTMMVATIVAQTAVSKPTPASTQVPRLIKFSGVAKDESGKPITGVLGVLFSLYKDQQAGAPLWMENQNVQADAAGHYTALLGSASADGVPLELFSSGEAQWLGVQIQGQPERPRVLLVSVPYALKAHEAETLSGRNISDFVLANDNTTKSQSNSAHNSPIDSNTIRSSSPPPPSGPTTFTGSNSTQIVGVTQSGSGTGLSATSTTHAAVAGTISGPTNTAVYGLASNTAAGSTAAGVTGQANTQLGPGVQGVTTSAKGVGVQGVVTSATGGIAVQGLNKATSGLSEGVSGQTSSVTLNSAGVNGFEAATTGQVYGVNGGTNSTTNFAAGVRGYEGAKTGQVYGVTGGTASSTNYAAGVSGAETSTTGVVYGVAGSTNSKTQLAAGVAGSAFATTGQVFGVAGASSSTTTGAAGVAGTGLATTGQVYGVTGFTASPTGGAAAVNGYEGATTGTVFGVNGGTSSTSTGAAGVSGVEAATTGQVYGVKGSTNSTGVQAAGVFGFEGAATGLVSGVSGSTNSSSAGASGVNGYNGSATGPTAGVVGSALSTSGDGVYGNAEATSGTATGVYGQTSSTGGDGVAGIALATTGSNNGVYGQDSSPSGTGGFFANNSLSGGTGVLGVAHATSGEANGVFGETSSPGGIGGVFTNLAGGNSLVIVGNGASFAQIFTVDASGNVTMKGRLTKGSGSFKIDHPLDPANKYLSHSFVESPDMMNVYNGNVTTDRHGLATVTLPDYFEALNQDFRYQLTVIGKFAQAIVAKKIAANRFVVRTSKPNVEVSWQVTGIRQDAYAKANRIPVEEDKPPQEQGHYLHPELFGAPAELAVGYNVPTIPIQAEIAPAPSLTAPLVPLPQR